MSRSLSYLSRGILGLAFVGSLGFGATSAFAKPEPAQRIICPFGYQPCQCPGYEYCTFTDPCNC
jgi:hypothetical protein